MIPTLSWATRLTHKMAEIHNFFSKLLPHFHTNHEQTFRDYVPNINESNKVLNDLLVKAFRSMPIKFKSTTRLSLELYRKRNSVLHMLLIRICSQKLLWLALWKMAI